MQAAHAVNGFSKKIFRDFSGRDEVSKVIRATDAKEVGVENPSEETFCRPDQRKSVSGQSAKGWPNCQPMNLSTGCPRSFAVTFASAAVYFPALTGGPLRLVVRTPAFHAGDTGSSPVGVATFCGNFCRIPPVLDVFSLSTPRCE